MYLTKTPLPQGIALKIFSYFFILIITSGLGNAVFGDSLLAGWKQFIIVIGYVICFSLVKKVSYLRQILFLTIFIQIILVFSSLLSGVSLKIVFFNLFFYSAWIPFFIWSARGGNEYYLTKYGKFTFYISIVCGLGLIIDLKTDIFQFLGSRSDELDIDFFIEHSEVVKRAAFIFTASTLVMPVLGGMIVIGLLSNPSIIRISISALVILIAIVTSATTNSIVIGGMLILGILALVGVKKIRIIGTALLFSLAVYFIIPFLGGGEFFEKQIGSVIGRQSLQDEGNIGRIWHWQKALYDIQEFNVVEHIVGSGLGTTNNNGNNNMILHTHGESSFLQAYMEGGIFGLALRVLPFFIIIRIAKKNNLGKFYILLYGYLLAIFLTDAVAPIFGNIPSQAVLGFFMGSLYFSKKNTFTSDN